MIRVLMADDHAIVRRGLRQIVSESMDIEVCAEASSGTEVLDLMREQTFDVVVLDLNMPGRDGFEILKQLKAQYPRLPVLVLSMYPENQFAVRVLRAGAAGYLTKESSPDQLVHAIRTIAEGGKYVSSNVARHLIDHLDPESREPLHEDLSDREFQVMRLIAQGKSPTDIARELSLSATTVSTYRRRVLEKLGLDSNAALVHYAIQHQLI